MARPSSVTALYFLQVIPILLFPFSLLTAAPVLILLVILFFGFLGLMCWRKRTWALTLSIFIQGMNVIIRSMIMFPNAVSDAGVLQQELILTSLLAIALSAWFLFRLDRPDVRIRFAS